MKLRTVGRLGVILSIILFCIGIGVYSFTQLSLVDKGKDVRLTAFVPNTCLGVLETDNFDYFINEFPQTAYANQLDTLQRAGLLESVLGNLSRYTNSPAHDWSNQVSRMMISFHKPGSSQDLVIYFQMNNPKDEFIKSILQKGGVCFEAKKEKYRGEEILIYPVENGDFVSAYMEDGFLAVSYQKKLIEQVIDAAKDQTSLEEDTAFRTIYSPKSSNFMTLYTHFASVPLLEKPGVTQVWSEFDIHLNSEVLYLSGSMYEPDSCMQSSILQLEQVQSSYESDSMLIVSGQGRIDSCVSQIAAIPYHSLFDECIANLSHDASYMMVADMDKVVGQADRFAPYLPLFIKDHIQLFRSFILSVQITKVGNRLSHIFVFTYKE